MKIAQIAPLFEDVPPKLYGGTERVVSYLTEELVRQGHEVTLFATGESRTGARLVPVVPRALRLGGDCQDPIAPHMRLLNRVAQFANEFDILHFHIDYLPFPLLRLLGGAHLTTLHGRLDIPDLQPVFADFPDIPLVSISDAQRQPLPFANWQATVHHGLPLDLLRFQPNPRKDYLAFLGRISVEKRVDRAIEIAVRTGMKLKIAAKVDRADRDYYEKHVRPLLNHPLVEFLGEITQQDKNDFLGHALALLFPIDWPEPFGLTMIEAMACGTPVIAFRGGAVSEVLSEGVTGFIVDNVDDAVAAVDRAAALSRARCRAVFEQTFTATHMAKAYLKIYEKLVQQKRQQKPSIERRARPEVGVREAIYVDDRWYVLAESSRADDRNRVLKHGDTFALCNRYGDILPIGIGDQGLYHEGTRFLSGYRLKVNGQRPMLLNSSVKRDNTLFTVDLTTAELVKGEEAAIPEGTIHLSRRQFIVDGVQYERLSLTNYAENPVDVTVELSFAADFADIFEVRGTRRAKRGEALPPAVQRDHVSLGYRGLDGLERRTDIRFSPQPDSVTEEEARFRLLLEPHSGQEINITVACRTASAEPLVLQLSAALERRREEASAYFERGAEIWSSNAQFNDWINRSAADLQMLVTETPYGAYPYAGVPWFSTVFGRDGIITALQTLWYDPALARGVLTVLAAYQATESNPEKEAEPGKILHEMRAGELAALNEIPFGLYYGTVDATPLFVMLAGAYWRRTGDRAFIASLWPHVKRALEWIDKYGDQDGDGFVEYHRHGDRGLVQQGWKDSDDSVFHADGSLAKGPIALCEVQGYVYHAKRDAAELARVMGEGGEALRLEQEAEALRTEFNERFWLEDLGTYAIALDGAKRPCRIRASNAGHALFAGIAHEGRAERLATTLLAPESFNGWGVRTVDSREARYNPMSYHNGSVWPHDTSIIALGLARYGFKHEALRVLNGLFSASVFMDLHRLPELMCGFEMLSGQAPTLYPVACSPQAWASGAVFQLLQAVLGLSFSTGKPQVNFTNPVLPPYVTELEIRNLRVGGGALDLALHRHQRDVAVNVLSKEGEIEVAVLV